MGKTGCLITADGSEDDKICPEGLPNYQVPPPLEFLPATTMRPEPNSAIGTDDGKAPTMKDVIEEMEDETPNDAGDEFEDHEDDRTYSAPYCRRKLRALYETGWHEGRIDYYNENLCKYHVAFEDSSEDYIGEDDIDMVDVIIC